MSTMRERIEMLKAASIDLAQLAQAGAGAQAFIDTLASKRQEAKALAAEIEGEMALALAELERVKDELRQKQRELKETERSLLALRQHIADDKAALKKLIDGLGQDMRKGRAA